MILQKFPVLSNPQIVITQVDGSLNIRTWKEQAIRCETEGTIAQSRQEGNTLVITGCKGTLELWIPAIVDEDFSTATDIIGTQLNGNVTIEGAGHVELREIGGTVTLINVVGNTLLERIYGVARLTNTRGDVRATDIPTLLVDRGIGGNASLSDISHIEIDFVGCNLALARTGIAEIIAVSGDMEAQDIAVALRSTTVGGDCWVQGSTRTEMSISNVAGDFQMEGMAHGRMSNIGGNLDLQATFPVGSTTRFHVEGNASVTVPEDASLNLRAIVGGELDVEALGSSGGGSFVNFIYGDGSATLNLNIGGDLKVLGDKKPSRVPY